MDLEILTPDDAAEMLHTSKSHVMRLVREHGLPMVMIGGKRRFLKSDLVEYIEQARQVIQPDPGV